jgi:hypothetical protein
LFACVSIHTHAVPMQSVSPRYIASNHITRTLCIPPSGYWTEYHHQAIEQISRYTKHPDTVSSNPPITVCLPVFRCKRSNYLYTLLDHNNNNLRGQKL